jgi:hypothetical protein
MPRWSLNTSSVVCCCCEFVVLFSALAATFHFRGGGLSGATPHIINRFLTDFPLCHISRKIGKTGTCIIYKYDLQN